MRNLCKSLSHFPGFMLCQAGIAWVGNDNCPECPIVVSQSYRIEDRAGYLTYLAARKYGCAKVNVRMIGDSEVTPTPIERIDPSRWASRTGNSASTPPTL